MLYWIVGVIFVASVDAFARRHTCAASPAKFWLLMWETTITLLGIGLWFYFVIDL